MMNETEMPFGNIASTFTGLGTAPALESIELGEDVPIAINPDSISRELERYVWFAGNTMTPYQKEERSDLRLGGEYFGQEYKCLVRSKGLVRRCQITPLEIGFDFMGEQQIGDNATGLHVVSQIQHADPNSTLAPTKLNAVQVFPGEEIQGILRGDTNGTNKGFVELKQLVGVKYADFRASGIQEFIFPEWTKILAGAAELPTKLSALVAHLTSRKADTTDRDIHAIIDTMLLSCDKYRRWGTQHLKYASALVRIPAYQGHVNTYSDLAEMLFVELELRREDMLADAGTQQLVANMQAGTVANADTQALLKIMAENQQLLTRMLEGQAAPKNRKTVEVPDGANVEATSPTSFETKVPTEFDPTKCSAITGAGTQCQNDADETGRCKHPAHSKAE